MQSKDLPLENSEELKQEGAARSLQADPLNPAAVLPGQDALRKPESPWPSQGPEVKSNPYSLPVTQGYNEGSLREVDQIMRKLVYDSGATGILLLDLDGNVVASDHQLDTRLVRVVSEEVARAFLSLRKAVFVIDQTNLFELHQQGERESFYARLVGNQWLLVTIYSKIAHLGVIKSLSGIVAAQMTELLRQASASGTRRALEADLRTTIANTVNLLFPE